MKFFLAILTVSSLFSPMMMEKGWALQKEDEISAPSSTSITGSLDEVPVSERVEDLETILTMPLATEDYVEPTRCLSRFKVSSVDIVDKQHVIFFGRGGKAWLNKLRYSCIGLRRHDIPQFDYRLANKICNLDSFMAVDMGFSGMRRSSASCVLGDFHPVTREQVILIRETFSSRKSRRK